MHSLAFSPAPSTLSPRPFLKWAGGKGQLISQYRAFFPKSQDFKTYYEPFLGGGAIFFHLQPQTSCLMDINSELVNVYQCIQQEVSKVIALLAMHQAKHCKEYYYQMRSRADGNRLERAARLIYLNRTCFNGLYRENSRGQFNVPIGSYKNPKICYPELLYTVSDLLQSTEILCSPFDAVLEKATGSSDFVYFDPPYYPLSATSNFTSYSRFAFMEADQIRLQQAFAELAGRGVKVMLSNSDCPFVRELYKDFPIHTISAIRAINSNAQRRGKITEVLVTSS